MVVLWSLPLVSFIHFQPYDKWLTEWKYYRRTFLRHLRATHWCYFLFLTVQIARAHTFTPRSFLSLRKIKCSLLVYTYTFTEDDREAEGKKYNERKLTIYQTSDTQQNTIKTYTSRDRKKQQKGKFSNCFCALAEQNTVFCNSGLLQWMCMCYCRWPKQRYHLMDCEHNLTFFEIRFSENPDCVGTIKWPESTGISTSIIVANSHLPKAAEANSLRSISYFTLNRFAHFLPRISCASTTVGSVFCLSSNQVLIAQTDTQFTIDNPRLFTLAIKKYDQIRLMCARGPFRISSWDRHEPPVSLFTFSILFLFVCLIDFLCALLILRNYYNNH